MVKNEYKYEIYIDDVEQFNTSIVTKEFLDSCKMAAKLFEKPKTNADRIRSMTDEELAELMNNSLDYFNCDMCKFRERKEGFCTGNHCKDYILKWLTTEVK